MSNAHLPARVSRLVARTPATPSGSDISPADCGSASDEVAVVDAIAASWSELSKSNLGPDVDDSVASAVRSDGAASEAGPSDGGSEPCESAECDGAVKSTGDATQMSSNQLIPGERAGAGGALLASVDAGGSASGLDVVSFIEPDEDPAGSVDEGSDGNKLGSGCGEVTPQSGQEPPESQ